MTEENNQNPVDDSCSGKPGSHKFKSCPEDKYRILMMTQMQIYRNHIDTHLRLHPHVSDCREKSLSHFFNMFGAFFRYIYCGFACENRANCKVCDNKFFKVNRVFNFEELSAFPSDFTLGVKVSNCHHKRQLNAIQIFLAKSFIELDEHIKMEYLPDYHKNTDKNNMKEFLTKYGHLLQEMFCRTVCAKRGICKCGNTYISKHYA